MSIFALVDCNNFYASCERVFNPALEKKPIVVLSNNDGCIIARSEEAKKLKIPMGAPFFEWQHFFKKNHVYVYSSNYALYGDMSSRVMRSLEQFCPTLEVYSIDEAFLEFDDFKKQDLHAYASLIKQKIKCWTGIPVSIGIAPTKTLAKIANHIAKKQTTMGVCDLIDEEQINKILGELPVADVWGIGRKLSQKMRDIHIHTAKDLRDADSTMMRKKFSVVVEKIICELRGISCLPLESIQTKQQIMSSRSFGNPVIALSDLEEAVSHYAAIACMKLRKQKSLANGIHVFIQTNLFNQNQRGYGKSVSINFAEPTDDSRKIIRAALQCLHRIYKSGYRYQKAGIMLLDLLPNTVKQFDLLAAPSSLNNKPVMKILDTINSKFGKNSIFICAEGIDRQWQARAERMSPRYTTQWKELPNVFCYDR